MTIDLLARMGPMEAEETRELGRCGPCPVRLSGLCGELTADELLRFKRIASPRTFVPGERILSSDERTEFFSAVSAGVVKITKLLSDGRQQIVGLLMPPDCLGRVYGRTNPYYAEAATEVELCCFPRERFERMLDDYPGLKQRLLEQTLDELDSAREWMVLLGRKTAEERVASLFLILAGVPCRPMAAGPRPRQARPSSSISDAMRSPTSSD